MDWYTSSSLGTPAPYGHACTSCARSKCKCIIRRGGGTCERCRRLNKECCPSDTIRRRSPRKPALSKTARLEQKLDSLVSLIKAGAQSGAVTTPLQATAAMDDSMPYSTIGTNTNTPTHIGSERGSVSSSSSSYNHDASVLAPATDNLTRSSGNLSPSGFRDTGGDPPPIEAEEYLIRFRTHKSKYFPFINIPSTTSAQQLRQERPFLWLCIMAVGSKSISQQQVLSDRIRQTIAQEMLLQSEKNIDLLLGLLTFIGWSHYQVHSKPFLAVFTQLAVSLIFDLELNKPVLKDKQAVPCVKEKYSKPPTPRIMEERRAVLGCFLITSILSLFLQKIDALRWTPHMDECLHILDERKECLNDDILVQQVRLQLIVEKIAPSTLYNGTMESAEYIGQPPSLYLETLHSQLQDIKTKLLSQPQTDKAVILHLHSTELDVALSPMFLHTNQLTFQQQISVNTSLEFLHSWFDVFFTIPPAAYSELPFSIFSQLARCLVTLHRLTTLNDPLLDETPVCMTGDHLLILDRVISNLEQVAILAGLDNSDSPEKDVFSRTAQMYRSLRPGWGTKLGTGDDSIIFSRQTLNQTLPPEYLTVEFLDNDWLMDLLHSPNH